MCSNLIDELQFRPQLPDEKNRFPIILIGAGAITDVGHLPAYRLANFDVQGIFDLDQNKAQTMATKWGIPRVFKTLNEASMFANSGTKPVIFDLAVPPTQFSSVLPELPEKAHVLLQKPMGETGEEARAIASLCEKHQMHASVNFQLRYAPHILALKDAIRRGWLGDKLTTIEVHVNVFMPWASWAFLASSPRIEPSNHSVHYIDLIRDLLKPHEPKRIHCRTSKHQSTPQLSPVRTNISLAFEHDPDLYVNIYTNHAHRWGAKNAQSYVLVEGTKGAAKAQLSDNLAYADIGNSEHADYLEICSDERTHGEWHQVDLKGYRRFPHAFIGPMAAAMDYAQNPKVLPATEVNDALKTMLVVEAAWRSSMHMTAINYDEL